MNELELYIEDILLANNNTKTIGQSKELPRFAGSENVKLDEKGKDRVIHIFLKRKSKVLVIDNIHV
jgi:hypothetical protein